MGTEISSCTVFTVSILLKQTFSRPLEERKCNTLKVIFLIYILE